MKKAFKILLITAALVCTVAMTSCTNFNIAGLMPHTCADANGDGLCDNAGCTATVLKQMTGVTFEDVTKTYDGKATRIKVEGAPEGAKINYSQKNSQKNAGEYEITATVTAYGYEPLELTATLTIEPIELKLNLSNGFGPFASSGRAPEVDYTLDGEILEGEEVEAVFDFGKCDFKEQKTGLKATVKSSNSNYKILFEDGKATKTFDVGSNEHKVSFVTGVEDKTVEDQLVTDGDTLRTPLVTRLGYELLGWYNGDGVWDFKSPVTKGMTLTAKWEIINYNITYHLNGGTNSSKNPATYTVEDVLSLSVPTKEGSVFLGWFKDEAFSEVVDTIDTNAKDTDLYAKWSDAQYKELVTDKTIDGQNTAITLSSTAVNGKFTYTFVADISKFDSDGAVYIGRGKNTVDGSYLKITDTAITIFTNGIEETTSETRSHIRKMQGYLLIEISVSGSKMNLNLYTSDGDSSSYSITWSGRNGEIFFESENVELTNASFGWHTDAYDSLTWIVGDGTIGSSASNTLTGQLIENKYKEFLTIGANGLTGADVLSYFKEACEISLPKYAIWSFMADPSENYDQTVSDFVDFCTEKKIVPILSTQPSTAEVDNTARNEAIRASGVRYVDFAETAAYDNVFVNGQYTQAGGKAIYARFMADFPEIVAAEATMRTEKVDVLTGVSKDYMYPANYVMSEDKYTNSKGEEVKYTQLEEHRKATMEEVRATGIQMNGNAIKDGKYMIFSAKIDGTLGEDQTILLGHGYMASTAKWIEIDGKYFGGAAYQSWGNSRLTIRREEHKLTIKNYITVIVTCDTTHSKNVTVFTDGGSYTSTYQMNGNAGDIFATTAGVTLTDVTVSWTCKDYSKDIWVFGDSYLSMGDPARWPTYLYKDKFYNALMVGASGMSAQQGLANLEDAIQYGTPKYIVWLEGMNNGEKNGAENTGYNESVRRLFEICEEYDIYPLIATIPCCPAARHEIKNEAIYNGTGEFAGKEYGIIYWARAVEDSTHETLWFDGMINTNDLIHPANSGARALYMQILVDFPEMIYGTTADVKTKKSDQLESGSSLNIEVPKTAEANQVYAFRADIDGSLDGTIEIGNGKGVEGGTWITIDSNYITAYKFTDGKAVEISSLENLFVMAELVNVIIHVKGDVATITLASAGEPETGTATEMYKMDVSWSSVGNVYASVQGETLINASLKWYSYAK